MLKRLHIDIQGVVQGVGFRPFIYRLAREMSLNGWVMNSNRGVTVEVEGDESVLHYFFEQVNRAAPPLADIQQIDRYFLSPCAESGFQIRRSNAEGRKTALILPDIATCPDCIIDISDPSDRRYLYPFTNCTNCGPRYSIIEAMPYDRANTSMKHFEMCDDCRKEYNDPGDRRFHAQPVACPNCGPHIELWDRTARLISSRGPAMADTIEALREGQIVAVKGLGGFHLMALADNESAVATLRKRKHRRQKPLAVMFPDMAAVHVHCVVSATEEDLLTSPQAPIVLLRRRSRSAGSATPGEVCEAVAPQNPYLGVMLPYTPLHHILLQTLDAPLVATSGNLADDPICIDENEALDSLGGIADLFLVHNRPILRHADDSIARIVYGRELLLRRARGYAPLPVFVPHQGKNKSAIMSLGGHLKNTIALSQFGRIIISPHIGSLDTAAAAKRYEKVVTDSTKLGGVEPDIIVCDAHPDYYSTHFALRSTKPLHRIQHHHAHVLSCMGENDLRPPALGICWDGTGYGSDGTIWGGEFLRIEGASFQRAGHFRTFPLPGGEAAIREPRRAALGLLYDLYGAEAFEMNGLAPLQAFTGDEQRFLARMLKKEVNCPQTSSAGRLFDAVAALLDLNQVNDFEGQAAMALEFSCDARVSTDSYPVNLTDITDDQPGSRFIFDWASIVRAVLNDIEQGTATSIIATTFHNSLAEVAVAAAKRAGLINVVLSGGCFQNSYLTEITIERLKAEGFSPFWHRQVPPNDGGISLGQIYAVMLECESAGVNLPIEEDLCV